MIRFGCSDDWPGAASGGAGSGGSVENAPGTGDPGMERASGIDGLLKGANCCGGVTDCGKPFGAGIAGIPPNPAWGAEFEKTLTGA